MATYLAKGIALGPQIGNVALQASVGLIGIQIPTDVPLALLENQDVCGNVLRARPAGEKRDGEYDERLAGESLDQHRLRRPSRYLVSRRS